MKHGQFERTPPAAPRKKLLTLTVILMLLVMLGVGGTLAYFSRSADPVINTFQAGSVGAQVKEVVSDNSKTSITVENTGASPVYVRVRLVSYWMSGENVAPKASPTVSFTLGSDWVQIDSYYYYTKPLDGGAETSNLLGSTVTMTVEDGFAQVIEVLADTVQATPAQAVEDVWGVEASTFLAG